MLRTFYSAANLLLIGILLAGCSHRTAKNLQMKPGQSQSAPSSRIKAVATLKRPSIFHFAVSSPKTNRPDILLGQSSANKPLPDLVIEMPDKGKVLFRTFALDEAEQEKQAKFLVKYLEKSYGQIKELKRELIPVTSEQLSQTDSIISEHLNLFSNHSEEFDFQIEAKPPAAFEITLENIKDKTLKEYPEPVILPQRGFIEFRQIPKQYRLKSIELSNEKHRESSFQFVIQKEGSASPKSVSTSEVLEKSTLWFTGEGIRSTALMLIPRKATHEAKDQLYLQCQLNRNAANLLAQFSKQHIGGCMAITLDGKIIFAAAIAEPILAGILAIPFDPDDQNSMLKAKQLRDQLEVKPLPLPVSLKIVED